MRPLCHLCASCAAVRFQRHRLCVDPLPLRCNTAAVAGAVVNSRAASHARPAILVVALPASLRGMLRNSLASVSAVASPAPLLRLSQPSLGVANAPSDLRHRSSRGIRGYCGSRRISAPSFSPSLRCVSSSALPFGLLASLRGILRNSSLHRERLSSPASDSTASRCTTALISAAGWSPMLPCVCPCARLRLLLHSNLFMREERRLLALRLFLPALGKCHPAIA